MLYYVSTALPATLSSTPAPTGNIVVATLPGEWPSNYPFKILIEWGDATQEAAYVTGVTGTGPYTLACIRGVDGTTAQAHTIGGSVYHGTTAEEFTGVDQGWAWPYQGDAVQRLAVPSYFYPSYYSPSGYWQQMQAAAPYVAVCAINPASGPGSSSNPDYVTQTALAQAAGIKVLGYVHTEYTAVPASSIEAQIASYYEWYGVDGIFIDEVTTTAGADQQYYAGLYWYVKALLGGSRLVVINPGTVPDESYMACCDIVCNCETDLGTYRVRSAASWEPYYPPSRFWHIIYATLSTAQRDEVLTLSRNYRAGYVTVTSGTDPDPYDTLPADPYFSGLVTQVILPYPVPSQAPVLEDGFDQTGGNINSQWAATGDVSVVSGELVILGHYSFGDYLTSTGTFSFPGRAATIECTAVPTATSGAALMQVMADSGDYLAIGTIGPELVFRYAVSGTFYDTTVTYNAVTHLWWRIDMTTAGVVTWQSSPDDVTWTVQRTVSAGLPVVTSATLELIAGHTVSGDPDQSASFDNVLVL